MDEEKQAEFREGPWSDWPFGVDELIRTSGPIVKVCAINTSCYALPTHHCSMVYTTGQNFRYGIKVA